MKLHSCSIHVNFDHNPSLARLYLEALAFNIRIQRCQFQRRWIFIFYLIQCCQLLLFCQIVKHLKKLQFSKRLAFLKLLISFFVHTNKCYNFSQFDYLGWKIGNFCTLVIFFRQIFKMWIFKKVENLKLWIWHIKIGWKFNFDKSNNFYIF